MARYYSVDKARGTEKEQEAIDKQWPGFSVTCACGSRRVELDISPLCVVGLVCMDCARTVTLYDADH